MKDINKNHCCPYCGSNNIKIKATPLIDVTLDDRGFCDSIDCHYPDILKSIDELGPEDFAITCLDCGDDCEIVFEGNETTDGWRLVKREDTFSTFDKKYHLLFQNQRDKKRNAK